jgi:hypothetical protein
MDPMMFFRWARYNKDIGLWLFMGVVMGWSAEWAKLQPMPNAYGIG